MLRLFNIVLFSAAVGAALGYLSFRAEPADYRSTVRIVIPGPSDPPADDRGAGGRNADSRVAQAKNELLDTATLQRALDSSLLLNQRLPSGGMLSLNQLRQCLSFDDSDEPPDVIVIRCQGDSAEVPQAILTALLDAYFVQSGQQHQAGAEQAAKTLERARRSIREMQTRLTGEAQLRVLADALARPVVDPAGAEHMSQQRADLILRRNHLQRELAQLKRGQPAAASEQKSANQNSGDRKSSRSRTSTPIARVAPSVGAEERVAQLLEDDRDLAARYGASHPKRQAIRLQIDLLDRYPPEQAQLLAEQWSLLQQFGPGHPNLKAIHQRLDELGIKPLTKIDAELLEHPAAVSGSTVANMVGSSEATPETQQAALEAALQKLDEQDRELTAKVEAAIETRELVAQLRQVLQSLPAKSDLQTIQAALARSEQLSAAQSALRPYLAMRPELGVRSYAGLDRKLLSGAGIGAVVGCVLGLIVLLARGTKRAPR